MKFLPEVITNCLSSCSNQIIFCQTVRNTVTVFEIKKLSFFENLIFSFTNLIVTKAIDILIAHLY